MLSITPTVNVFLALDPVDMRKGFHGLTSLTESILSQNPVSGHWFFFPAKTFSENFRKVPDLVLRIFKRS